MNYCRWSQADEAALDDGDGGGGSGGGDEEDKGEASYQAPASLVQGKVPQVQGTAGKQKAKRVEGGCKETAALGSNDDDDEPDKGGEEPKQKKPRGGRSGPAATPGETGGRATARNGGGGGGRAGRSRGQKAVKDIAFGVTEGIMDELGVSLGKVPEMEGTTVLGRLTLRAYSYWFQPCKILVYIMILTQLFAHTGDEMDWDKAAEEVMLGMNLVGDGQVGCITFIKQPHNTHTYVICCDTQRI